MTIKLLPCPFCGMEPPEDDLIDTLYPSGTYWRERLIGTELMRSYHGRDAVKHGDGQCWTMHCTENMGGCGAEISGDSAQEAIDRWNRRVVEEKPNTVTLSKYISVYDGRDGKTFVFSANKLTWRAKCMANYIFAPGDYTIPMKDRHGIFTMSHPNVPSDSELMSLLGY